MNEIMTKIIEYGATAVSVIGIILSIIFKLKNTTLKDSVKQLTVDIDVCSNLLPQFMQAVEKVFTSGNGEFKEDTVKEYVRNYYLENNIKYDDEKITEMINTYIAISKSINVNNKEVINK